MPTIDPEVDAPIERIGVALLIMIDVKEVAPVVAPLILPTIAKEEEVQMTRLSVSLMLVKLVTAETVKEEVPIMMGSLVIDVGALLAATDVLMGEVIGEAKVSAVANLPVIQAMAKVLLAIVKLLAIKIVGEIAGEVGVHGEAHLLWWNLLG